MAQDSLRCRKMAPNMLQDALKTLQDSSKRPIISPMRPLKKPTFFKNPRKTNDFRFLVFSLPMAI
eukprot:5921440-Pyramimonas_sp.AAC.1